MCEADLKLMFDGPEVSKTDLFGAHTLVHHIVKGLILALTMFQRTGYLNLIKDAEIHDEHLLSPATAYR